MRWLGLVVLFAACDSDQNHFPNFGDLCACRLDVDLSTPPDLPAPDLAPWCEASGPAPTCQGQACAAGCTCVTSIVPSDGGISDGGPAGKLVGTCDCSAPPPASPSTGPHSGVYCCGGMFCAWQVGWNASCSATNDCHAGP